jgi:hypothetical protein
MQYTQDYDEKLPNNFYGTVGVDTDPKWVDVIQPYVKSTQLFTCPSDSQANREFVTPSTLRTGANADKTVATAGTTPTGGAVPRSLQTVWVVVYLWPALTPLRQQLWSVTSTMVAAM